MTDTEPDWASHQRHRPPVRHPAAGGGLEAHGLDANDPAGHAAAVVAGLIPDQNGRTYAMAAARPARGARRTGGPHAAA